MHKLVTGFVQIVPESPRAVQPGAPVKKYAKVLFMGGSFSAENPRDYSGDYASCEISVQVSPEAKSFTGDKGTRNFVGTSVRFGEILNAAKK